MPSPPPTRWVTALSDVSTEGDHTLVVDLYLGACQVLNRHLLCLLDGFQVALTSSAGIRFTDQAPLSPSGQSPRCRQRPAAAFTVIGPRSTLSCAAPRPSRTSPFPGSFAANGKPHCPSSVLFRMLRESIRLRVLESATTWLFVTAFLYMGSASNPQTVDWPPVLSVLHPVPVRHAILGLRPAQVKGRHSPCPAARTVNGAVAVATLARLLPSFPPSPSARTYGTC